MAYLPNKPQATDNLSVSQGDIQGNFSTANTVMGIDHFPFDNATAVQGFHKPIHFLNAASPSIANANLGIYAAPNNGSTALWVKNAVPLDWPLWSGSGLPNGAVNGQTSMFGGIVFKWGKVAAPGSSGSVVYPTAFNNFFSITFGLLIASGSSAHSVYASSVSTTGFSYTIDVSLGGTNAFYWMAIGN